MTTTFIHPGTGSEETKSVSKKETLSYITNQLKAKFNVSSQNNLILCLDEMGDMFTTGILLKAPFVEDLKTVYCYEIPVNVFDQYFKKVYVYDNSMDSPELEFLLFHNSTLQELERMYIFTKSPKNKSFRFVRKNDSETIPKNTLISSFQNQCRLKLLPNMTKVRVYENQRKLKQLEVDINSFKGLDAAKALTKFFPNLVPNTNQSSVNFKYYDIDLPPRFSFTPQISDEVNIIIKPYVSPVSVRIEDANNILVEKILEKKRLYYRTAKQIFEATGLNPQDYKTFELIDSHGNKLPDKYYKEGNEVIILISKLDNGLIDYYVNKEQSFEGHEKLQYLKKQLRQAFQNTDLEGQNKQIHDLLMTYIRSTFD